jgi:hypothetical protein
MTAKQKKSSTKTVTKTKRKRRKPETAPRFHAGHLGFLGAVGIAAAFSTIGTIATVEKIGLVGIEQTVVTCVTAALTFMIALIPICCAPAWAISKGWARWLGLALMTTIMLPDAGLQANALREATTRYQSAVVVTLTSELTEMKASGQSSITINSQERRITKARNSKPAMGLLGLYTLLFQIATFFGRAWLTMVEVERNAEIKAERKAKQAPKQPAKPKEAELKDTVSRHAEPKPRFQAVS